MLKEQAKPGTKVIASIKKDRYGYDRGVTNYYFDSYEHSTFFGEILDREASVDDNVWIKWDIDRGAGKNNDIYNFEEEQEIEVSLLTAEEIFPSLEQEYQDLYKNVKDRAKERMEEVAKIIKETNQMIKESHVASDLSGMWEAIRPLLDAMDASGWQSSSWNC